MTVLDLDPQALVQIGLAVVLGGIVGVERELRGRAAGLRTMIIVCLGSTLIMIVSTRLPVSVAAGEEAVVRIDPGRIAAGIVTGIGFLGAGVIIKLGDLIRGVTTAASIWFVAALGIVIGRGDYALAVTATVAVVIILWLFQFFEKRVQSHMYRVITLQVGAENAAKALDGARSALQERGMSVLDLKAEHDAEAALSTLRFYVRTTQKLQAHDVVRALSDIEGVRRASWK